MKTPAFQFYPADWRKDPGIQSLSLNDRGAWFEMLCLMHESPRRGVLLLPSGEAMQSKQLARILGVSSDKMNLILKRISISGVSSRDELSGAILCRRMVRDEELSAMRREIGAKGGNPNLVNQNANQNKKNAQPKTGSSSSPSSSPSGEEIHNSSLRDSPAPSRARDLASDFFAEKCLELTQTPYVCETGDFVMLAKLRKAFGTEAKERPPGWEEAVTHYFGSPLSQYSLADLANPKRYAVFRNSPLDGFNKPVNHNGNGKHESKAQGIERRNEENARGALAVLRARAEQRNGPGTSAGPPGDVHGSLVRSQRKAD